jgi:hypothetical protein
MELRAERRYEPKMGKVAQQNSKERSSMPRALLGKASETATPNSLMLKGTLRLSRSSRESYDRPIRNWGKVS